MPRKMTRESARQFYQALATHGPPAQTELIYHDAFTLLIAVVLSAQATDIGVNKATTKLFAVARTPQEIFDLGELRLGEFIRTIGLWRNKAKNVIALCRMLIDEFEGVVPQDRDALERLPGVGRKTANVVCNEAFGQPTIAVDTHLIRIGNRTRLAPGKTPLDVEKGLLKITPDLYLKDAHHWLILHGRYVCKARAPECWRCIVVEWCLYTDKALEEGQKKPDAKKVVKKNKMTRARVRPNAVSGV